MMLKTATAIAAALLLTSAGTMAAPAMHHSKTATHMTAKPTDHHMAHSKHHWHHRMAAKHSMQHHRMAMRATRTGDREVKALNVLEAAGYSGFQDMHPQGQDIVLKASKNGSTQNVTVTPSGQIRQQGI